MRVAGQRLQDVSERNQAKQVGKQDEKENGPDVIDIFVGQCAQVRTNHLVTDERTHGLEQLRDAATSLVPIEPFAARLYPVRDEHERQQDRNRRNRTHHQVVGDEKAWIMFG